MSKYTSDKPSKDGWYWFRYYRNSDSPIDYPVHIRTKDGIRWVNNGEYETDLEEMNGYWAKIEKPEDED